MANLAKAKSTKPATSGPQRTLVVVESPSKAKTIGQYLGSRYKVIASVGHVRDLPKSKLGVDVENDFEPNYINIRGKGDKIKELKKETLNAKRVLLATDPDREGEAISWHLAYLLGIDPASDCRVEFHEINKATVTEAIKHPRPIDMGLVDSQQARRVLDRLVGYQISPLLWKKVRRGLSAGRVQSAALKILCDRENEILNFIPEEYWNIIADFGDGFQAKLSKISGRKANVRNAAEADRIEADLQKGEYTVSDVKQEEKKVKAYPPFTTSSLQQDASIKLNFQTQRTMRVAQELYEGVKIDGLGQRGLITYLRTDSTRVSQAAKADCLEYIGSKYGEAYKGNNYFSSRKDSQDAHEAIRPSDVTILPSAIKDSLTSDQYKLYHLIWTRFVASQMAPAVYDTVSVGVKNGRYEFRANGATLRFDGWKKVYKAKSFESEATIPPVSKGDVLTLVQLIKEQKFTQPPSRYTEASLVKEMEEKNIGRPSTYASIISTLTTRQYVKRDKKTLVPTKLGFDVTGILEVYFSDIVNVEFTGEMEDRLDDVALCKERWQDAIGDFYKGFSEELKVAEKEAQHVEPEVVLSDEVCEVCGRPMAIKQGRFGTFLACTGYPECRNTRPIIKKIGVACPKCGKDIVQKVSKRGKVFYGCSGYPACDVSFWDKPVNRTCPVCGSLLVEKQVRGKQYKCSNPECKYKE
ncbi:MAG: type I DNA topoisomerase [Mogibacterium sp.]|nr:type I DNA topoisomerase [Mogibacterium sp.]